jgi:hypothetical protein
MTTTRFDIAGVDFINYLRACKGPAESIPGSTPLPLFIEALFLPLFALQCLAYRTQSAA